MLHRLTSEKQRELEKALDTGAPVSNELALAGFRELLAVRAIIGRWVAFLDNSDNPRLRTAARALKAALEPNNQEESTDG